MICSVYITAGEWPAWFRILNDNSLFSVCMEYFFPTLASKKELEQGSLYGGEI